VIFRQKLRLKLKILFIIFLLWYWYKKILFGWKLFYKCLSLIQGQFFEKVRGAIKKIFPYIQGHEISKYNPFDENSFKKAKSRTKEGRL
jgi:hypothetical protein